MTNSTKSPDTQILRRDDLPLGGFAGLREHQLVMDSKVYGPNKKPNTWDGVGNFIYLADARFIPLGETGLHPHEEVDVISVMAEGRIAHGGSLGSGQELVAPDVQVQRAGGEGFNHNEVNPDDTPNRMIQLWVLPERSGERAGYKVYTPKQGAVTRVYGGEPGQDETFASGTVIDVALLNEGQEVEFSGTLLAYVTKGQGLANGQEVTDGDLVRTEELSFSARTEAQLTVVHLMNGIHFVPQQERKEPWLTNDLMRVTRRWS